MKWNVRKALVEVIVWKNVNAKTGQSVTLWMRDVIVQLVGLVKRVKILVLWENGDLTAFVTVSVGREFVHVSMDFVCVQVV